MWLASRDTQRGKSGGYRVIYYLRTETAVILIAIYFKGDRDTIADAEVQKRIEEYEAELTDRDLVDDDDPDDSL